MNKTLVFAILAFAMFSGSLLCGYSPTLLATKARNISVITLYGAGLLIGVSLIVIIPEGIRAMYLTSFLKMKQNRLASGKIVL